MFPVRFLFPSPQASTRPRRGLCGAFSSPEPLGRLNRRRLSTRALVLSLRRLRRPSGSGDENAPQSPLLGRVEAWGEGKRNRTGNIVHHTFCLIIAIFILEYPSAGASAEEMRETTCKGQTNCLSNSNRMPDLNREIFSHHFIAFSHARGHLVSRASRLQLSQIRQLY